MRLGLILLIGAGLAACTTAPALTTTTRQEPTATAPFTVPMDPGQISCMSLSNSTALTEATNWTLGRARAAVLSGRITQAPIAAELSQNLVNYCQANPANDLAAAAAQLGY